MGSYPLHFSLCHRGYQSAKEGISELIFDKHLSVDLLMILAAIGSGLIGYWMEGALLIFIFSLSSTLEELAMEKSKNAIAALMNMTPPTARKIEENGDITVLDTADHPHWRPPASPQG